MKHLSILLSLLLPSLCHSAESRTRININPVWRFHLGELSTAPVQPTVDEKNWETVSLPHTHQVFPADLSGFTKTGRQVGWYRRMLSMPDAWKGKKVFLEFQGAMQTTKLWVNGTAVGEYNTSGYDSFHFDITSALKPGSNQLAIRVDNSVNPNIPPDGQKTDFIQFGGLYRDVHVVVTDPLHITFPWEDTKAGIRLTLPEVSEAKAVVLAETQIRNASDKPQFCTLLTEVRDRDGKLVTSMSETQSIAAGATRHFRQTGKPIPNPNLWSPENPCLYQVHTIVQQDGRELDRVKTRFGIRWVTWDKKEGFFLNGKHLKLVGANRHQTWPFIGNAVPDGLHRRDAEQLKEMGCNWVRCSHYPHDPDFLDDLDELGIMALEEGPTWMKTGGRQWMDNLEQSFRRMIRRDRNHASLIIWNACVNHSGGNKMLIAAAKEEDPTRARGQDNVPCPMNFKHKTISGNGALCIEHTGHTFDTERGSTGKPGKAAVGWVYGQSTDNREYELTRRHWEHTDAAYKVPGNSGLAVWCMYDYNTFHNATAAIARHGVLDLFRIPKYSWWWHQSELTEAPMAYIIRINETEACVLSNGEEVRLLQHTGTGQPTSETRKPDTGFSLRHPPFHFKVSPQATALKAEALKGGKVVASHVWKKPGPPAKLTLHADRSTITADGADISRIIVSAVDANGTETPACTEDISFTLEGKGQLIGENPVQLRAGKMIILVQSSFSPGTIKVRASAKGLAPASTELVTTATPPGMDMPSNLPATQPGTSRLIVKGGQNIEVVMQALAFEAKQNVEADQWIESDPIMLDVSAPLAITGGEYRIYTSNWTDKPGRAGGGDAVFVRVKSPAQANGTSTATLTVGNQKVPFTVTTRP